jgi:23S rRNA pseudouridine1911/1915/1917 synthase
VNVPPISFVVDRRESGQTLAAVLKSRLGLSWSQAKRLVEGRHVRVGQEVVPDVARRLKPGNRILVDAGTVEQKSKSPAKPQAAREPLAVSRATPKPKTKKSEPAKPEPRFEIEIVYSDDSIVVVNKPAGLTTMRHKDEAAEFGRGKRFLPTTLADRLPQLLGEPGRPVIAVHRIDRDTSGLVVFARTQAAAVSLMKQFRKHSVDRRYLALVRGTPIATRIESILVPDRGDGRRGSTRKTAPPDGKPAVTHVKVIEELGLFAVVECRLETGRTHQVRIHLGENGAPLCGERIYDRPVNGRPAPDGSGAERPMLHAARLGFTHPETNHAMTWDTKPPEDFSKLWASLRQQTQHKDTKTTQSDTKKSYSQEANTE